MILQQNNQYLVCGFFLFYSFVVLFFFWFFWRLLFFVQLCYVYCCTKKSVVCGLKCWSCWSWIFCLQFAVFAFAQTVVIVIVWVWVWVWVASCFCFLFVNGVLNFEQLNVTFNKQAKQLNLHDILKSYIVILLKYPSDTGIVVASWIADKMTFRFGFYCWFFLSRSCSLNELKK